MHSLRGNAGDSVRAEDGKEVCGGLGTWWFTYGSHWAGTTRTSSEVLGRRMGLATLGSKVWSAAMTLTLVAVTRPACSSQLLWPCSWSYVVRHEHLHLLAATWMQNLRTHPVSKCCPSQRASWNNTLHCCPTFIAGAEDMLQPAPSSWPGVMQGPGAGQHQGEYWRCLSVFTGL